MTRPVDTFTVGFKDHTHLNELEYAERWPGGSTPGISQILIDESDMKGYLEQLVYSQDEPIADWVCIPLYFVSKLARDSGTTVVQVGEGSDEQFCGYSSYMMYLDLYHRYWRPYRKFPPALRRMAQGLIAAMPAPVRRAMYADILDRAARNREHFWSGAVVFWDALKRHLIDVGCSPALLPSCLVECGLLPASTICPIPSMSFARFSDPFDTEHPGQRCADAHDLQRIQAATSGTVADAGRQDRHVDHASRPACRFSITIWSSSPWIFPWRTRCATAWRNIC